MKTIGTLLFTLILSGFYAPRCGATVYHSNGSVASVQALHNVAHDGDTITLPAGIFSWTARLNITKGITIQGQTTISGAGTANPIINDGTIIIDNVSVLIVPYFLIKIDAGDSASKRIRITGLTFRRGTRPPRPASNGGIIVTSSVVNKGTRIDHIHWQDLDQFTFISPWGSAYGVADNNVVELDDTREAVRVENGGLHGNSTWAQPPLFGTDNFWFVETNTFIRPKDYAITDGDYGGKLVFRHNYVRNGHVGGHGTEGAAVRGVRAVETYENTFEQDRGVTSQTSRSGTYLVHDNTLIGPVPNSNFANCLNFRVSPARAFPIWGTADGTSIWDANDTDGRGHFVEGDQPHLFASGAATANSVVNGPTATMTDTGRTWVPHQWKGFSIRNMTCSKCNWKTSPPSDTESVASYIIDNDAHTITYMYYSGSDSSAHMIFATRDQYQIHRVLMVMDSCGRGRTDRIEVDARGNPYNTRTPNIPSFAHSQPEPLFSWNNVGPNNEVLGIGVRTDYPITKENIDFFNLRNGISGVPSQVYNFYNATRNGVQYRGNFPYPHPLTRL
jgi:hypothetical protein